METSQVWELSRLCTETSKKLYVHEFGFRPVWFRIRNGLTNCLSKPGLSFTSGCSILSTYNERLQASAPYKRWASHRTICKFQRLQCFLRSLRDSVTRWCFFEVPKNPDSTFWISADGFHNYWLSFCGKNPLCLLLWNLLLIVKIPPWTLFIKLVVVFW